MSRRFEGPGLRRGLHQNAGAAAATPASLLGALYVGHHDSMVGIDNQSGVQAWLSSGLAINCVAAAAGNRPVYAVDASGAFPGASVVQCATTGSKKLKNNDGGADIFAAGTKPYVMFVARLRTLTALQQTAFCMLDATTGTTITGANVRSATTTGIITSSWFNVSGDVTGGASDTLPHVFESYLRASDGKGVIAVDGVEQVSVSGAALAAALKVVQFGHDRASSVGDWSIRAAVYASAEPDAATRTALRAYWPLT